MEPHDDGDGDSTELSRDIEDMPLDRLREEVISGLELLAAARGWSYEDLGHQLGYETGSQLSKIRSRAADLSLAKAKILDQLNAPTTSGISWVELAAAISSRRKFRRVKSTPMSGRTFDVFLALPMASTADEAEFQATRKEARDLVEAIQNYCHYTVYCAALGTDARTDFDSPGFALADNVPAMLGCRKFVLYVPSLIEKPSSIWVEAGMALALQKPSIYLLPERDLLPYILQQAVNARSPEGIGPVAVHWTDKDRTPTMLVRRHKESLFNVV